MEGIFAKSGWTAYTAWRCLIEKRISYLAPEDLHRRQSARVRRIVAHAWDHIPHYRAWLRGAGAEPGDIGTAEDLRKLPLIGKLDLTREPGLFSDPRYEHLDGLTLLSSGTSGLRRTLRYNARALFDALAAGRRQRIALARLIGREAGYKEAVLNREGNAGMQIRSFWESRLYTPRRIELRRRRLCTSLPFEEILAGLNAFRPEVLRGFGSHLGAFLRWVHGRGLRFHKPLAVTYGGDAMSAANRKVIEQEMGIPVVSTYQAVEALRIGFQCEERQGFHLSLDQVDVRVVDAEGRDVGPGERGELVLSNLTNRATVVLNYRLGDMVTLGRGPCSCGRTFPLINGIDGRLDDLIARPGGSWIPALAVIPSLQAVAGVQQLQIVQEDLQDFRIRVVWAHGEERSPVELCARMARVLGDRIQVRIEPVDRIEMESSGKVKTLISKVSQAPVNDAR